LALELSFHTGLAGNKLVQVKLFTSSPKRCNQRFPVGRLEKAVQFLGHLLAASVYKFRRQFLLGPIGLDAHQDEDAEGTHQDEDDKTSEEAGPDGDGFSPGEKDSFY
jgi:hypothetical protein